MFSARTSFSKRIQADGSRVYEITVPFADGKKAFYRLSVDRLKEKSFQKALKDGLTVDLTAYGTILESYYLPQNIIQPLISEAS